MSFNNFNKNNFGLNVSNNQDNYNSNNFCDVNDNYNNDKLINDVTNKNTANTSNNGFNLQNNFNARAIWGAIVSTLHKQNEMSLFAACGEIREIKIEDHKLLINVRDNFLFTNLTKESHFNKLQNILKQINSNLELKFVLIKKKEDKVQINLARLKELFNDNLEVVD